MKVQSMLAATLACAGLATAHSWVETMYVVRNGKYAGTPGYARGYVDRDQPGGQEGQYMVPAPPRSALTADDLVCSSKEQTQTQAMKPRLNAAAGDYVSLVYLENGHVTLIANDIAAGKVDSGRNYIYATMNPVKGQPIQDVLKWTTDGSIDSGKLLTSEGFDDGRCFEMNGSPKALERDANPTSSIYCETDFQIPSGTPSGSTITVYWVWDWPTPGVKDQIYTSCMDINIVDASTISDTPISPAPGNANINALSDYKTRANDQSVTVRKSVLGSGPSTAQVSPVAVDDSSSSSSTHIRSTRTVTSTFLTTVRSAAPSN